MDREGRTSEIAESAVLQTSPEDLQDSRQTRFVQSGAIPAVDTRESSARPSASQLAYGGSGPQRLTGSHYDAGPALLAALDTIDRDDLDDTVQSLVGQVTSALHGAGVRDTQWVHDMLFQYRGIHQNVHGDRAKYIHNVEHAKAIGAIGPHGESQLLARAHAAPKAAPATPEAAGPCTMSDPDGKNGPDIVSIFTNGGYTPAKALPKAPRSAPARTTQAEPEQKHGPDVHMLAEIFDQIGHLPLSGPAAGTVKSIKVLLGLVDQAERQDDAAKVASYIAELGELVFELVGQIALFAGKNEPLAKQALEQLEGVAHLLGHAAKVFDAISCLSKIVFGKTVNGKPVDTSEQVEAVVDLVGLFPGIGNAIYLSIKGLEWTYALALPAYEVVASARGAEIIRIFKGKTAEVAESNIRAMSSEPEYAVRTSSTIERDTFHSDQWWQFYMARTDGEGTDKEYCKRPENVHKKTGDDLKLDAARSRVAEAAKNAAIAFIHDRVKWSSEH